MIEVWQNYRSDLGRAYPMFSVIKLQVNDVPTNINPISLLPQTTRSLIRRVKNACSVGGLTQRYLILYLSDGAQFKLSYPEPFSQDLYDYLTLNTDVAAFEFVGERLKYGRLKRLLDNVRP
jgi:hypothetical protein